MSRALRALAVCAAGVAVGAYTLGLVRTSPEYSFAGASVVGAIALLAGGWALVASAFVLWLGRLARRVGLLFAAAGFAWFLLEWNNPGVGSPVVFTAGLCLYGACPALVGHAVLSYPSGRLTSWIGRAVVAAAYLGGILVLGVLPALLFDPVSEGCGQCPRNLMLVADRGEVATELRRVGVYLAVSWTLLLCLLALGRLVRAPRFAVSPVLVAGAVYFALVASIFAASAGRGFLWNGAFERRLWLGQAVALFAVSAGVGGSRIVIRRARMTVARLVVDLAQAPPAGSLRDALAEIVGDPDLVLAYPVGETGRLVAADGRTVDPGTRPAQTSIVREGRRVAALGHAVGLLDDTELLEHVTEAARLALENERLQAEVRARLEELRASQLRIVAAGDRERRRLERDLHDGAQQRLVALALTLRLLRTKLSSREEGAVATLSDAEVELVNAIAELRELAHGIFPAVLADGGFAVAVRALAEDAAVPVVVETLPERRFSPAVETAAYTVVAEVARAASASLRVRGSERDGVLVIEVETTENGNGLDPTSLLDRLGALDGSLSVDRRRDGVVTVRAELPCGS